MYRVELSERFKRDFKKLDKYTQKIIRAWIEKNIEGTDIPRLHGKALHGNLEGLWRYRIGDYRLIAKIEDDKIVILLLRIGHRKDIYN